MSADDLLFRLLFFVMGLVAFGGGSLMWWIAFGDLK